MYHCFRTFIAKIFPNPSDIVQIIECNRACFCHVVDHRKVRIEPHTQIPNGRLWSNDGVSNGYVISANFRKLLFGADQKKFCLSIVHE